MICRCLQKVLLCVCELSERHTLSVGPQKAHLDKATRAPFVVIMIHNCLPLQSGLLGTRANRNSS